MPIKYVNSPKDKVATNTLPEFLNATFAAQGWLLFRNSFKFSRDTVKIDLSSDFVNNQIKETGLLEIINTHYAQKDVQVITCKPSEILVEFEESIEKKIPLIVPKSLTFMQGYDAIEAIKVKPDSIIAVGPKSVIDTLERWFTDSIKHISLNATVNNKISIRETEANIVFDKYLIGYEIDVAQYTEKKLTVEVKIINKKNSKFLTMPKKVNLKCLVPVNKYDEIRARNFSIVADYKKKSNNNYINLKLNKKAKFAKKVSFYPKNVKCMEFTE